MNYPMTLDEKNKITVMLMQALQGAISANFRMVAISLENPIWKLQFVLAEENAIDREEIEDIITEFDALLGRFVKYDVETLISNDKILATEPTTRIVFLRRED
ncbi:hypothetical protein [Methylovulum psychrotolerans]|jgi:hypothetical protein|uniref:Uncharacterized protein n=1 Tax=Methylovulum psychrotolerans TaxID=1704499 RepID=A0A2S5CM86_9GAMM|nr:hypothetical protein [Methylovulum psychrotolerans]MBT9096723.1 hypothetical protein [Methylovulum psychrotolerans]POZ51930.1 hypothetical protein AADEFJLK_02150 [Methylovulum psychrotolerans]